MTATAIESRLAACVRLAGEPSIDHAWWIMGWRVFSEWMDFYWTAVSHPSVSPVVDAAYGYEIEIDVRAHPDMLILEVSSG